MEVEVSKWREGRERAEKSRFFMYFSSEEYIFETLSLFSFFLSFSLIARTRERERERERAPSRAAAWRISASSPREAEGKRSRERTTNRHG